MMGKSRYQWRLTVAKVLQDCRMDGSSLDTTLFSAVDFLLFGPWNSKCLDRSLGCLSRKLPVCLLLHANISSCLNHDYGYEKDEDSDLI